VTFPLWRQGLATGVVVDVGGTTFTTTIGVPDGVGDYGGLAWDAAAGVAYSLAGGGHAAYNGDNNGVYAIDFMQDAPRWRTVRASSSPATTTPPVLTYNTDGSLKVGGEAGFWGDGRPVGCHNYRSTFVVTAGARKGIIRAIGQAAGTTGEARPWKTHAFWLDTLDWDLNSTGWPAPPSAVVDGLDMGMAHDPVNHKIWCGNGYGIAVLDYINRTFVNSSFFPSWDFGGRGTTWAKGFWWQPYLAQNVLVYSDPGGSGGSHGVALVWTNGKPALDTSTFPEDELTYDSDLDRFYLVNNGKLIRIDPNTGNADYIASVGGFFHMQRLCYIPALGGLLFMPNVNTNFKFFPTTNSVVTPPTPSGTVTLNGTPVADLQTALNTGGVIVVSGDSQGAVVNVAGSTVTGAGSAKPKITGVQQDKGVIVAYQSVTLNNLELSGASVSDLNGAGIRHQGGNMSVQNCSLHHNQDGFLSDNGNTLVAGSVSIVNCDVFENGTARDGQCHGVYIGRWNYAEVINSRFYDNHIGHHLKIRAALGLVDGCILGSTDTGDESFCLDLPTGGEYTVQNCTLHHGPNCSEPYYMLKYGAEWNGVLGMPYATNTLTVRNCIFSSSYPSDWWQFRAIAMTVPVSAAPTACYVYDSVFLNMHAWGDRYGGTYYFENCDFNFWFDVTNSEDVHDKLEWKNCRRNGVAIADRLLNIVAPPTVTTATLTPGVYTVYVPNGKTATSVRTTGAANSLLLTAGVFTVVVPVGAVVTLTEN
jgi:hypothetical protein